MDKKKAMLNIIVSLCLKIFLLFIALINRKVMITQVGNDANGLNSLYINIISIISVSELGIGSAIIYSMYKPIVDNDTKKVAGLYNLYKKIYLVIASIIMFLGLIIIPALPTLANGITDYYTLYLTYTLFLISVVLTYLYSARSSLINAYKNNYITTLIEQLGQLLLNCLQILILIFTQSFILFVSSRIITALLQLIITKIISDKLHKNVMNTNETIDAETKQEITKNVKAMFFHKIGAVIINSTDSIIISSCISVGVLGLYGNYSTIVVALVGILNLIFSQITSIIGHAYIKQNEAEFQNNFHFFHNFNFIVGCIFFLGFYAIINPFIELFYGADYILASEVIIVLTLNYFIQFMRSSVLTFRDATGTFYYDRYKAIIEGLLNLILSLVFVKFWGIFGVLSATVLTNLFICHIIEPYVLYKHAFKKSPKSYYLKNYSYILIFILCMFIYSAINKIDLTNNYLQFLINGILSVIISLIPVSILIFKNKNTKEKLLNILKKRK